MTRIAYGHSFWKLKRILFKIDKLKKRKKNSSLNSDILHSARLSMAIRWMASGDKLYIAPNHGVEWNEVMKSIWEVVDKMSCCESLKHRFPSDCSEQQRNTDFFEKKSGAIFSNYIGFVDGMLIWIEKSSEMAIDGTVLGSNKYFCGRKEKYGLIL